MKTTTLRTLIPIAIGVLAAIGFATHGGFGDLSAWGWQTISMICPVGALTTMLASKVIVPRAVISLVVVVVLVIVFGRAFCAWACPVPVASKLRVFFAPHSKTGNVSAHSSHIERIKTSELDELTEEEKGLLKTSCGTCAEKRGGLDARHWVLGGSLLSAAIFGFPVFCLICPVGLSFATIFLLMRAFGFGDVTWAIVIVPAFLILEVVVFRRWCHTFCPISALMSLVAKANKTFRPSIDDAKCLETAHGATCGRCGMVCEEGIDPRHPELGSSWNECTKCRACVEVCPSGALKMPFLAKASGPKPEPVTIEANVQTSE